MNTIYLLDSDLTNFSFFIQKYPCPDHGDIKELAMRRKWKPFGENYQPPELELRRNDYGKKNYQFDFSGFLSPFFIISETALEELKDILEPRGQILPVMTESRRKKFWGYYPTNPLSGCMDMEKSVYTKYPNGLMVEKPVLIAGNITDDYLFSIEEDRRRVFVTDKFRQRVEAAGLAGFDFSLEIPTTDSLKSTIYMRPEQAITRPPEMQNIAIKCDTYDTQTSRFYDDEQQGFLYILQDSLDEGLYYAKKNNRHCIRIVREGRYVERENLFAARAEGFAGNKAYIRLVSETDGPLDLSPAMGDDNIHRIVIDDSVPLAYVSFNALYSLKNLKSLSIPYIKCDMDFSALRSLEELYIDGSDTQVPELHLPELKHLLLRKVKNKDLSLISKLQNLRLLRICQGSVQTLSGAEYLPNLKKTELAYCRYLQDISAIATLPALTELEVEKCKNVTDFSFLKGNVSVKKMLISELDSLDFLPEMKNIEDIFFEKVKDGNLHYLLQSKSLKKFDFAPDKKYYSHKHGDLLKLFEKQREK